MFTDLPSELLSPNDLFPDDSQPRRSFGLAQLESLKDSIASQGILQPLIVRWDRARKRFVIVCGERRWRCAKELGLEKVPCRVVRVDLSTAEILLPQLIENLQREDLNPIDEARSLERLQKLLNCSREEVAAKTHRSTASICRSFKLLELPPEVQSLVESGQLPASTAAELHRCSNPMIQRELAEKVAVGSMTRDDVVTAVRRTMTEKAPAKSQTVTLKLGSVLSMRVSGATSLKECESAVSTFLRNLRVAKPLVGNMDAFAQWQQEQAVDSHQ